MLKRCCHMIKHTSLSLNTSLINSSCLLRTSIKSMLYFFIHLCFTWEYFIQYLVSFSIFLIRFSIFHLIEDRKANSYLHVHGKLHKFTFLRQVVSRTSNNLHLNVNKSYTNLKGKTNLYIYRIHNTQANFMNSHIIYNLLL